LGKHRLAIDVYNQAQKMGFDDWELCHSKGLCLFQLGDMAEALKSFKRANILQVCHALNFVTIQTAHNPTTSSETRQQLHHDGASVHQSPKL
jgi:hypothetical protein